MGLIAGIGLILIGLTGSVLVFKDELDGAIAPEIVKVTPSAEGRMSYDALIASARKAVPGHEVLGWDNAPADDRADLAYVVAHGTNDWKGIFVDPYTGKVQNTPTARSETLTGWLLEMHYSFLADHPGELAAGIFAALLFFLGITGVWMYRGFWKTLFTLRWGRSARIFFSDLHKMVGISSVAFNLILGFTGAWWNLSHLIGHLWMPEEAEPAPITRQEYSEKISIDGLIKKAGEKVQGFTTNYISLPSGPNLGITLYGQTENGPLAGPYGSTVMFDQQTGELREVVDVRNGTWWTKVVDTFTPLHFGTFGGLPVKILWCLGGLTPGILAVTGFLMWWKRRKPGKMKKAVVQRKVAPSSPVEELAARRVEDV